MRNKMLAKLASGVVLLGLLSGCSSSDDPQPTTTPGTPAASSISVKVSEGGAPSYDLAEAKIVSANYQTGATSLVLSGKLNNGSVLILTFSRSGTASVANTTNTLAATLGGVAATSAYGATALNSADRTVAGTYQATFVGTNAVSVSGTFSGLPVQ